MITDWRIRFEQGYLPFLLVQLPNISGGSCQYFREAQAESLQLPNVGMAVSIDVGDPYDIHPNNKKPVASAFICVPKRWFTKIVWVSSKVRFMIHSG